MGSCCTGVATAVCSTASSSGRRNEDAGHPTALDVGGEPVVGEGIEILHAGGDAQVGLEGLFALGRVVSEQDREAGKARVHVVLVGGPGDELAHGLAATGRLGVDLAAQDIGSGATRWERWHLSPLGQGR